MNTNAIRAAEQVLHAAMEQGRVTAAGLAMALDSACLIQSPETAAELAHLRISLPAQMHRADTLNWICKEQRQRADVAEARVAELEAGASAYEVPRPGALPLLVQRVHGHADRWFIADREGRRWTRHVGWCPEFGGCADERLRDDARFTLVEALPLARRLAVEDPHDSLIHHEYRTGRDLPETPHA